MALIGAAIPVATLVQGWLQRERELAIQELEQLQQLRMAYMNAMVEGGADRVGMLADFIADTELDPGIRAWADRQRDKSRTTIEELQKRISAEQDRSEAAEGRAIRPSNARRKPTHWLDASRSRRAPTRPRRLGLKRRRKTRELQP